MLVSGAGVLHKLSSGKRFQCACLGSTVQLPLGGVTILENFGMAFMAFAMLVIYSRIA